MIDLLKGVLLLFVTWVSEWWPIIAIVSLVPIFISLAVLFPDKATETETTVSSGLAVVRVHDADAGVTCWLADRSISCLRDEK